MCPSSAIASAGDNRSTVSLSAPLLDNQAGQVASAGDHRQATVRPRQQRTNLFGRTGVVQHHQHSTAVQQRSVQSRLRVEPGGDLRAEYPQRVQEPLQDLSGVDGAPGA